MTDDDTTGICAAPCAHTSNTCALPTDHCTLPADHRGDHEVHGDRHPGAPLAPAVLCTWEKR